VGVWHYKRMTILPLMLLMSGEAAAKSAMTLAMADSSPQPGDAVSIEVRWTNIYDKPLRIPASWADELKMWVFRVPPGEKPKPQQVASEMEMSIMQARKMDWITVAPGEVLSHSLAVTIDACAEGCIGGSYYGQVNLSWGMIDGRRDDQILPAAQIPFNFDVALPLDPVNASPDGVQASLADIQPPTPEGNISATVAVTNGSASAVWVPGPQSWLTACTLTDKKGETVSMQSVGGQAGALTEEGYQLLAAGEALSVPISCEAMFEGKLPKKSGLSVLMSPISPFFPINNHEDRSVLTGLVPTGAPVVVPKK